MTVSDSLLAYQSCIALMDQALADDRGARLKVAGRDAAFHERQRIHYARKLHRKENLKVYDDGHPMHGKSEYDALVCRIKKVGEDFYLYLERTDKVLGTIEPLSAIGELPPEPEIDPAIAARQAVERLVKRRV